MDIGPPKGTGSYNFELLKIQDGGRPPCWEIEKWSYLGNGLTDLRDIWHGDARRLHVAKSDRFHDNFLHAFPVAKNIDDELATVYECVHAMSISSV